MSATLSLPFDRVSDWIFDLDNCLYPASTGLFSLIDERMGAYIQQLLQCGPDEARRVQKAHFHAHGTTLAGLMAEHDVDRGVSVRGPDPESTDGGASRQDLELDPAGAQRDRLRWCGVRGVEHAGCDDGIRRDRAVDVRKLLSGREIDDVPAQR